MTDALRLKWRKMIGSGALRTDVTLEMFDDATQFVDLICRCERTNERYRWPNRRQAETFVHTVAQLLEADRPDMAARIVRQSTELIEIAGPGGPDDLRRLQVGVHRADQPN